MVAPKIPAKEEVSIQKTTAMIQDCVQPTILGVEFANNSQISLKVSCDAFSRK
jgi:hypothetical protein